MDPLPFVIIRKQAFDWQTVSPGRPVVTYVHALDSNHSENSQGLIFKHMGCIECCISYEFLSFYKYIVNIG